MTTLTLVRLIRSLSGPEKRQFKLYCRKQSGDKNYLALFDLIDKSPGIDVAAIREQFRKQYPGTALHNATHYLVRLVTDSLVQSRTEKDNFFQLLQEIMRMRILKERALTDESQRQLVKIRKSAVESQQHWVEYFTYREHLNHIADSNFPGVSDSKLIEGQMKAKEVLKSLNHIQDHHSLFELLKYRLVYSGKIAADNEKKRLNDLMLSEMTLVTNKSKNSFASQKLHLLFQSFFFTDIGDYQSALKTFHALNKLFEQHLELLDNPPLDYLSALTGILDSLHTLRRYNDMQFYLEKLALLDQSAYPEYFRYQTKKTMAVYRLAILTGTRDYEAAVDYVQSLDKSVLEMYAMVAEEKQWELYFYCGISYTGRKNWKKAHGYVGEVMQHHRLQPHWLICKATRLLNIILHYEKGDANYLEYEIRSYKRFFQKTHALLRSELLLLKFMMILPDQRRKRMPELERKKLVEEIATIVEDKYEWQLLKYFDFTAWLLDRLR